MTKQLQNNIAPARRRQRRKSLRDSLSAKGERRFFGPKPPSDDPAEKKFSLLQYFCAIIKESARYTKAKQVKL